MTTPDYNPESAFLEELLKKGGLYTNFPFSPLANESNAFDQNKFADVGEFCKEWGINTLLVSNLYYIIKRILPSNTIDGLQKISNLNSSFYKSVTKIRGLKDENLSEIIIRAGKKSIIIKDSVQLKKIKKYLLKYADKEALNYEKTNFRSEAYSNVSKLINSYFERENIEQLNDTKRYEMIGRLMMLAGLKLRANKFSKDARKGSRQDFDESDPEVTGIMISNTVRNWVKK